MRDSVFYTLRLTSRIAIVLKIIFVAYNGASDQQKRRTSGHFRKGIFCKVIVA
jgi:hypothetical protein